MIDKLVGPGGPGRAVTSTNERAESAGTGQMRSVTGSEAVSERVSLTERSARLQALESAVRAMPAVDAARVEAARTAIAEGSLVVDGQQVAERIIELEGALYAAE